MADEEESFPRGRAVGQASAGAAPSGGGDAFLFGEKKPAGGAAKKTKKRKAAAAPAASAAAGDADADAVAENAMVAPKKVNLLTYKRLSVGMGLLGQVAEVKDHAVVLSLPDSLTGHVSFLELSERHAAAGDAEDDDDSELPTPAELLSVGDLVRCVVVNLHKSRGHAHVDVSLRPTLINSGLTTKSLVAGLGVAGTVDSVEDHGYTVDLGIAGTSGFVSFKDTASQSWKAGRPVECVVKELKKRKANKRVVMLGAMAEDVAEATVVDFPGLSLGSLQPGMLVNVKVKDVMRGGVTVTFLRHFVGVVDILHLHDGCIKTEKESMPEEGDKRSARILYVDQVNKVVGLTFKSGLCKMQGSLLPESIAIGTTFEDASVVRVDAVLGLCLSLPGVDTCTGFAHISRLSDERIEKVGKQHTVGTSHQCRVVSHSLLDGLANVSLEESVLAAPFLTYTDVKVGSAVSGKILSVETYGVIVGLTDRIRGLCPSLHLGELVVKNPQTKFKIGTKVQCHVLSVDAAKSRVVLSMKKSFTTSKLPQIMKYSEATPGTVCEGYISAVKDFGCIITFFNDVHGLAPKDMLAVDGITNGEVQPEEAFRVGQTVKVKVLSCTPDEQKMLLSLDMNAKEGTGGPDPNKEKGVGICHALIGTTVSGTVLSKTEDAVEFKLDGEGGIQGQLRVEHLSDHDELVDELIDNYDVGQTVENMLVLQASDSKKQVALTLKPSLVKAASTDSLPSEIDSVSIGDILNGYVSNVTNYGVFVNFMASLSGLALRSNVADEFVTDPSKHFEAGQSVRARVLKIDAEAQKVELSLMQSDCGSEDSSFLSSYFVDVCAIAELDSRKDDELQWYTALTIGGTISGTVENLKYGGVVVDLGNDVTGFVKQEHCKDIKCEIGQTITAKVLDADPRKAIVDLSLQPALVKKAGKSTSKVKIGSRVKGTVQLVKTGYLVLTLDKGGSMCFANCQDYNSRILNSQATFSLGATVDVEVVRTGKKTKSGNQHETIVLATIVTDDAAPKQARKKQKTFELENNISSITDVKIGMLTTGQVHKIHKNHMTVILGPKIPGRVHMADVCDDETDVHVLSKYEVGQRISGRVIGMEEDDGQTFVDLSLRPSVVDADELQEVVSLSSLSPGQSFSAPVDKVDDTGLWLSLSRELRGRVAVVDASTDIAIAGDLEAHFKPGHMVKSTVLAVDKKKKTVDLSLLDATSIKVGDERLGLVTRIKSGDGMFLRLPNMQHGRVHVTDSADQLSENPFTSNELGQLVKCSVVAVDSEHIELSTRESALGGGKTKKKKKKEDSDDIRDIELADVQIGQKFQGYVRRIAKQGCFVSLSRVVVGRVILRELSDSFVSDPAKEFPAGKLVSGVVINVDAKEGKIELSMKTKGGGASGNNNTDFDALEVGQKLKCTVKRIEAFGIFLSINKSSCTGLAHKTEISDTKIKASDLAAKYSPGDHVVAMVLKLNPKKKQISLSMKASHFEDDEEAAAAPQEEEEEDMGQAEEDSSDEDDSSEEEESEDDAAGETGALSVEENDFDLGLAKGKAAMDVDDEESEEDDSEEDDSEEEEAQTEEVDDDDDSSDDDDEDEEEQDEPVQQPKKKQKIELPPKQKKKVAEDPVDESPEDTEARLRQREDALADPNAQLLTDDDYQREVIASPNSSIAWIKYMAFQLSIGEIEKARKVVENALKTISFRQEDEKLNVWVASLNLENMYGTKETLAGVFERAILYNDPKQVYLKMVEIHKKAENIEMVEDMYKIMTRKFKKSAEIWCDYGAFKLEQADSAAAKGVLEKSLTVLDKSKHVSVISKFGENEFKMGDKERGRTYFESVLENAVRRVDVWSVYLDMEIKYGDEDRTERLFERATSLSLSTKKMKFLFKKNLEYAKSNGDQKMVARVKARARAHVEALTAA